MRTRFTVEYIRALTLSCRRAGVPVRGRRRAERGVGRIRRLPSRRRSFRVHVVVVGCGRVGSSLALSLTSCRPHGGRRRPPVRGLRPPRRRLHRHDRRRHRLRPRPAAGGRHRAGRRGRRRHQRRQLEHPHRPRRPGDLRDRAGRRPHLRPPPRRDLPAPRHPDGGHGAWATERVLRRILPDEPGVDWVDPSAKVVLVERVVPGAWGGHARRGAGDRRRRQGGVGRPATARRRCPSPAWSCRRATSSTSPSPATPSAELDAHLAGPAKGGH